MTVKGRLFIEFKSLHFLNRLYIHDEGWQMSTTNRNEAINHPTLKPSQ